MTLRSHSGIILNLRRENGGSERLSDLPSVTQHKAVGPGFRSRELASSAHPVIPFVLSRHAGLPMDSSARSLRHVLHFAFHGRMSGYVRAKLLQCPTLL